MNHVTGITQPVVPIADIPVSGKTDAASGAEGFMDSLKSAMGKVNDAQIQAGQAVDALMTGQTQDIHRTMVALQQADVSFQLMMQIRNKLVTAYEEIQRMQV